MLIEIQSLSLTIENRSILHDVNLRLQEGEIYGLVGPNGAGKSTTIFAALGLRKRSGGTINVLGQDPEVDAQAIQARCGVLPEQNGFYGWMDANEYLAFFAELYGHPLSSSELAERLAAVGLAPRRRQPIDTFSQGMRQRLGLARALIGEPALLILDEPTNGLDPRGRREIHDVLIALAGRGVGILLCTHLLDDVERLCHRIGVIAHGRTIAEGNVADLVQSAKARSRFRVRLTRSVRAAGPLPSHVSIVSEQGEWIIVHIDAATSPQAAWREMLAAGWPIAEIHAVGGGLEDVYFDLTEKAAA